MTKVVIDMSMSPDGFIAGPRDGPQLPLAGRGAEHIFDWYFSGNQSYQGTMFKPSGADREVVAEMFQRAGVMLTGRRTYDIANGWHGAHPVNGMPVVILTHEPPLTIPKGQSQLVFVTEGC